MRSHAPTDGEAPTTEPAIDRDELMRLLTIGRSTYYERLKEGRFDHWLLPDVGVGPRFNRRLVQKWLDGGGTVQTSFGLRKQRALKRVG